MALEGMECYFVISRVHRGWNRDFGIGPLTTFWPFMVGLGTVMASGDVLFTSGEYITMR